MVDVVARFRDNGNVYRFEPQKDITAYELAMILPLANSRGLSNDGKATQYLIDNNLMRHFVKE
jgi:hypothetical protein